MKSVLKAVAPVAMTLTFALSGFAMADTATESQKNPGATTVTKEDATTVTKESVKPVSHHHHESIQKTEASKDVKKAESKEQAAVKETTTPVTLEKSAAVEKGTVEKTTTVATAEKTVTKTGTTKIADPAKAETGKSEQKKASEPAKSN